MTDRNERLKRIRERNIETHEDVSAVIDDDIAYLLALVERYEKANESAYPTEQPLEFIEIAGQPGTRSVLKYGFTGGLTKRELFAAMAMQALIPTYVEQVKELENAASAAVEYADALLKELERETK